MAPAPPLQPNIISLSTVKLVKPKKHKKDKFAGLTIKIPNDIPPPPPSQPIVVKRIGQAQQQKSKKPKPPPPAGNKNQKLKKSKFNKTIKQKTKQAEAKLESKQRNNILLLANVLKMNRQSNSISTTTSSNLQCLLK